MKKPRFYGIRSISTNVGGSSNKDGLIFYSFADENDMAELKLLAFSIGSVSATQSDCSEPLF